MSLDAIALEVAESTDAAPEFLVATDARRKEVYWARYALAAASCRSWWTARTSASRPTCPTFRSTAPAPASTPTSSRPTRISAPDQPEALYLGQFALARLAAGEQLLDSTPLYLRESDAQVPGPRKRAL